MGTKAYGTFRKVQNVGECFPEATPNRSTIIELNIALTQYMPTLRHDFLLTTRNALEYHKENLKTLAFLYPFDMR